MGQNPKSQALSMTDLFLLPMWRSSGLHSGEPQPLAAAKGRLVQAPLSSGVAWPLPFQGRRIPRILGRPG